MAAVDQQKDECRHAYDYEVLKEISRGAYGVVYRARDIIHGEIVAMKQEFGGLCESTLTEIDILRSLPRHPRIIEFKRAVKDESNDSVLVVMEYLEYDLKRYMKARKNSFTLMQIKTLTHQLLDGVAFLHDNGVAFLHDNGVMHRDLKPANILIKQNNNSNKAELKICDFGLSALTTGGRVINSSPRVGSRWYRAPELLLGSCDYSCAVDMWSVGCIMAELVSSRVLFRGGSDDHQLPCIHEFTSLTCNLPLRREMATTTSLTRSGLDLLERLLAYDPEKRISARDALNHAWFKEI